MSDDNGRRRASNPPAYPTSTTTTTTHTLHAPTTTTTFTSAGPRTTVTSNAPRSTTISSPTVTTTHHVPVQPSPRSSVASQPEHAPSIRIRRSAQQLAHDESDNDESRANRRRSFSEPDRPEPALLKEIDDLAIRRHLTATPMQTLHEEGSAYTVPQAGYYTPIAPGRSARPGIDRQTSTINLRNSRALPGDEVEFQANIVNVLDVIGMAMLYIVYVRANLPCVRSGGLDPYDSE